jgi:hypothetical protein
MGKIIRYSLLTCTLAYFIAAVLLFLFSAIQFGFNGIDRSTDRLLVSLLTLVLSEFQGWHDFWYLSVLVPWLGSSLLLTLLTKRYAGKTGRRRLWGGVSVGAYYVILLLVFAIGRLIASWGRIDINPGDLLYLILLLWPLGGFGLGYLSAIITDKIVKLPVTG